MGLPVLNFFKIFCRISGSENGNFCKVSKNQKILTRFVSKWATRNQWRWRRFDISRKKKLIFLGFSWNASYPIWKCRFPTSEANRATGFMKVRYTLSALKFSISAEANFSFYFRLIFNAFNSRQRRLGRVGAYVACKKLRAAKGWIAREPEILRYGVKNKTEKEWKK